MSCNNGHQEPSLPGDSWPQQISGPEDVERLALSLIHVQQKRVKKALDHEHSSGAILDRAVSMELRRLIRQIASYRDQLRPGHNQTISEGPPRQGAISRILAAVFVESDLDEQDIEDEDEQPSRELTFGDELEEA
ncbi:MAG: hypothetical protein O2968_23925 [Acidobacteria bacterium]|nr:hypothetical protein [Acidobacteriota bacterium]